MVLPNSCSLRIGWYYDHHLQVSIMCAIDSSSITSSSNPESPFHMHKMINLVSALKDSLQMSKSSFAK